MNNAEYMSFTEWMLWNRTALQQKKFQFINKSAIKSKKPWSLVLFLRCFILSKSSISVRHTSHMPVLSLPRLLLNLQSGIFTRMQGSEQCSIDVRYFSLSHPVKICSREKDNPLTSCLDSFQSSLRSISWNDSWDLGPFLISRRSMLKINVLSGGIFPAQNGEKLKPTIYSMPYKSRMCQSNVLVILVISKHPAVWNSKDKCL